MFDNINKSKIAFEKYIELKTESLTKSYTERFKYIDRFLYWFSWFGNGVSIFLAFFFIQALFLSSFVDVKDSIFITAGITIFLTIFELLKRYVFAMFSTEIIKSKFSIFKSNMISFMVGVFLLVSGSFYMSLNGAFRFVDNKQIFTVQTETNINTKVDSINTFYLNQYIRPLMDDNKILTDQNTDYAAQAATTSLKTRYTTLIEANNKKIESNKTSITQYETRRDNDVTRITGTLTAKLDNTLSTNKSNVVAFIILSSLVEIIIMLGIYYDKFYNYKIVEEYEKTIIETPGFKKWYKFNFLLGLIYSKTKEIGTPIPSSNGLTEMAEVSGTRIDKTTLDKFVKILYYLEIVKLEGNRRILNMTEEDGLKKLRDYFEIK